MTNRILVTGGAGYIGSHTVYELIRTGYEVVILDNFSTGHRSFTQGCKVIECDLRDRQSLNKAFEANEFDAVMHFAAKSVVSESVRNPLDYFENNVIGSINLIRAVTEKRIKAFVFSSTAAVYGDPITEIIDEQHPIKPINPYGQTKAIVESPLMEASRAYGLSSISFRYFNAAGAAPERMLGEDHQPETHLIPNVLKSCLSKRNPVIEVFGTDYDTRDGSCVRDYVHVKDLAEAHTLGMAHLLKNGGRHQVNLGTRDGASVLEVIRICERVTGVSLSLDIALRREGDPPSLIANNALARNLLGWAPTRSLEDCIRDAWLWHKSDFRAE